MFYLCRCVLLGGTAKQSKLEQLDLDRLYEFCEFNSLTAMVCISLQNSGVEVDDKWKEALAKSIRKNMLLDAERARVFREFEKNGIWYMPLKGVFMKEYYPAAGMRQMADNDILYDKTRQNDVIEIFRTLGYDTESIGKTHHDVYFKEPLYNFEMHTMLIGKNSYMHSYYKNIKEKLLPVEGKSYEYRFREEDFYIYMTVHAYKHYSGSGTGLRTLIDYYVYLQKMSTKLDWEYIYQECQKLEIVVFEQKMRTLSEHAFARHMHLSDAERKTLRYMLFSGTYGTRNNSIIHISETVNANNKATYIFRRFFPNKAWIKKYEPTVAKYPVLYPLYIIRRFYRLFFVSNKSVLDELKTLRRMDNRLRNAEK